MAVYRKTPDEANSAWTRMNTGESGRVEVVRLNFAVNFLVKGAAWRPPQNGQGYGAPIQ
jgi:hypothetical protein